MEAHGRGRHESVCHIFFVKWRHVVPPPLEQTTDISPSPRDPPPSTMIQQRLHGGRVQSSSSFGSSLLDAGGWTICPVRLAAVCGMNREFFLPAIQLHLPGMGRIGRSACPIFPASICTCQRLAAPPHRGSGSYGVQEGGGIEERQSSQRSPPRWMDATGYPRGRARSSDPEGATVPPSQSKPSEDDAASTGSSTRSLLHRANGLPGAFRPLTPSRRHPRSVPSVGRVFSSGQVNSPQMPSPPSRRHPP